jgi:hypothetical protein
VYHHPALANALIRDRVAELHYSAGATARGAGENAHSTRAPRRPNVVASARLRTGWLLVEMGLRLAMPRGGTNHPVAGGRR